MKPTVTSILKDYLIIAAGIFFFLITFRPFGMYEMDNSLRTVIIVFLESVVIYLCALFAELITDKVLRLPPDYSKDMKYNGTRLIYLYLILLPFLSLCLGEFWIVVNYGWGHPEYYFITPDKQFTLKWFLGGIKEDALVSILVFVYTYALTSIRVKSYQIDQLKAINAMLEEMPDNEEVVESIPELSPIEIQGESKDSITVSPSDILFIESIANYVSVWYQDGEEIKQKRLRSTLKSVEQTLSEYDFLVHCHRAFMVNINFITHIEGNAAGCQLQLFSVQKSIPVSKANIELLRSRIAAKEGLR